MLRINLDDENTFDDLSEFIDYGEPTRLLCSSGSTRGAPVDEIRAYRALARDFT